MRRSLVVVVLAAGLARGRVPAFAAWLFGGSGSGRAAAQSIGVPTSTVTTATSTSTISITWAPPSAPSAPPGQYVVRRTAPTTTTVCTVTLPGTLACIDTGLAPSTTYSYTVEAKAGTGWSSGPTPTFSATTPGVPTFLVQLVVSGAKTAGTAFAVHITATTNGTTTDTSYGGVHSVSFSGPGSSPSGTAPSYPATVTFVNGVSTPDPSITLFKAEAPTLVATDGTRSGSVAVSVVAASPSRLAYSASTPSCSTGSVAVGNGGTFTSKVSLLDAYGNAALATTTTAIGISRTPVIGTLSPTSLTVAVGAAETSASFTFTGVSGGGNWTTSVTATSGSLTQAACTVSKN